jgi:8-oxo-dGTP pyrophosphatase MutT (NUDIX family)
VPTPDFILELRSMIGTHPLWLVGVTAVVLREHPAAGTQVLLVRRADNGWWTPVTGIVDPGEHPADAAVREVLEEAGVVAVAEHLSWVNVLPPMTYDNGDRAQYLDLVFRCRWRSGEPYPADGENSAARWYPLVDLPDMPGTHPERIRRAIAAGHGPAEFAGGAS